MVLAFSLAFFLKTTNLKQKKQNKTFFFSLFLAKRTVAVRSLLRLVPLAAVLLQLLGGQVLLQVALVARQRQAVCDAGQEGHGPTVLLHLGGLLLHVHLVAAGGRTGSRGGGGSRVTKAFSF